MLTETKVGLGILGALVGVSAVAALANSSSSSIPTTPATPTTPTTPTTNPTTPTTNPTTPTTTPTAPTPNACGNVTPAGYTWEPVVHGGIGTGDHVRISMSAANFATFASAIANLGTGITGWSNLLALPAVSAVLGTTNICAWAPGDLLPTDWPTDDVNDASEYHADFIYTGPAIMLSALPITVEAWVATPPAAAGATGPSSGGSLPKNLKPGGITHITQPTQPTPQPAPPGKVTPPAPPAPVINQVDITLAPNETEVAPNVGDAGSIVKMSVPATGGTILSSPIVDGVDSGAGYGPGVVWTTATTGRNSGSILLPQWQDTQTGDTVASVINYGRPPSTSIPQTVTLPEGTGEVITVQNAGVPPALIVVVPPSDWTIQTPIVVDGQSIDIQQGGPGDPVSVQTILWSGAIDVTLIQPGPSGQDVYAYATILYGE